MQRAKAKRLGRPPLPKGTVREKITPIRLQGDERTAFEMAARKAGLSLSEWMRKTLNESLKV
jgi:predicted HicB family RNase H-like nuclease